MNFVKKLIGKVQDYKNNEVVYAEDYNKDFNLLREVINNNANGIAEAFANLLGLSDDVREAIEGVITINSVNGSAIVDHTIAYEKLAESTLLKLPNKNELTDLNDNLAKSYYYNEALPANNLHNIFIRHYTEAEQNVATPATIGFTLNKNSFLDASAEFLQYVDVAQKNSYHVIQTPAYTNSVGHALASVVCKSGGYSSALNYNLMSETATRLQFFTEAFENVDLGAAVKTLVLTNNDVQNQYVAGRLSGAARNLDLTFVITYTDNTTKTVLVSPGSSSTVTVPLNGTSPKNIKSITATTAAHTGFISTIDNYIYSYPTVTLNYDASKLNKISENQFINNPSDGVYVHIIASEAPNSISLIANGVTTVLTMQRTETAVTAGYNEYVYTIDCSESKANAQNFNIKIEMASTAAKLHGYYIAG